MSVPRIGLRADYSIPRLIKGNWQLAGDHGAVDRARALAAMAAHVEAGITCFDCADIYAGAEALIGEFRAARPDLAARLQVHTKFVPDRDHLARIDRAYVRRIIDRSLARLGLERLDLVQFHWWDYAVPGWIETAGMLADLQRAGKIRLLGGTNFDVPRARALLGAGIDLAAMQVQYSLLDARPAAGMVALAREAGFGLLCYGTLAGGFLSETWLGQAPPQGLSNRSLIKYRLIIEEFGGWALFQDLLGALADIAVRHRVPIAAVAIAAALDLPGAGAAIVGSRHGDHLPTTLAAAALTLTDPDREAIAAVLGRRRGPAGDVYELERDAGGPHARIMKYGLNDEEGNVR